jgi:hypothetical protein
MRARLPARLYDNSADIAVIRADGTGGRQVTQAFPTGGSNEDPVWATGAVEAAPSAPDPLVSVPARGLTSARVFYEVAANDTRTALLSSIVDTPVFYEPTQARLTRGHGVDCDDFYGLVLADKYAAWFTEDAGGVVDPYTDVSLTLTSLATGRSVRVATVERSGHFPPYATGPRLAADGSLIVYNPESRGSKLFRVDTKASKPKLRLLAKGVAVEDVDRGRIVGWRGNGTLVALRADGRVVGNVTVARSSTTSVALDGSWLFTTTGDRLTRTDVNGNGALSWELVDDGGPQPTLAGVSGDLAVYVSGVALNVLRLSSGRDVVLRLPSQGTTLDAKLTDAGLFYAHNGAYVSRPGRVGYVTLHDLAAGVSDTGAHYRPRR